MKLARIAERRDALEFVRFNSAGSRRAADRVPRKRLGVPAATGGATSAALEHLGSCVNEATAPREGSTGPRRAPRGNRRGVYGLERIMRVSPRALHFVTAIRAEAAAGVRCALCIS
jgi:hypothetical protein